MSESLITAFETATTAIKTDVLSMAEVAIPAALAIAGIIIAVKLGMKLFKSVAN